MKKTLAVIFTLALTLTLSTFVYAEGNSDAFFKIDATLGAAGYDGGSTVSDIGADQYVGFAIYVNNVDNFNAFLIDISWDADSADLDGKTGLDVTGESITINGAATDVAAESNLLGAPFGIPDAGNADGTYVMNYAALGTSASSADYGLVYYVVLKTSSSFTVDDAMVITAKVSIADAGVERYLGARKFNVNGGVGVKTETWGKIKKLFE